MHVILVQAGQARNPAKIFQRIHIFETKMYIFAVGAEAKVIMASKLGRNLLVAAISFSAMAEVKMCGQCACLLPEVSRHRLLLSMFLGLQISLTSCTLHS